MAVRLGKRLNTSLMGALEWAFQEGLQSAANAMKGRSDPDRDAVLRSALSVLKKVRDTVLLAESSELASYAAVKASGKPPKDPLEGCMWVVKRVVLVLKQLRAGELEDPDELKSTRIALQNLGAAVEAVPIEQRVEAARILREGKRVEKRRQGPTQEPTSTTGRVLRLEIAR